ncbi:hypothetical protein PC116_g33465 [Phytophthora cactorum]|nr:hypothetical protein PC116_g33465 [Phytophthora cactorum]
MRVSSTFASSSASITGVVSPASVIPITITVTASASARLGRPISFPIYKAVTRTPAISSTSIIIIISTVYRTVAAAEFMVSIPVAVPVAITALGGIIVSKTHITRSFRFEASHIVWASGATPASCVASVVSTVPIPFPVPVSKSVSIPSIVISAMSSGGWLASCWSW